MIAYKFLRDGRVGPFSGVRWPKPGTWLQAADADGSRRACGGGVHACRAGDLPEWIDSELWRVELDGDVRVDCGKLVAGRGRLVEQIAVWDTELMAAYAEQCTLRVRDAALTLVGAGPARVALAAAAGAADIAAAAAALPDGLPADEARAAGYAGDAARHVLGARAEAATAPMHAAVNGFIAAHAAAFAEDDLTAVARERAWQAAWIARAADL